jgi:hypothetical protein
VIYELREYVAVPGKIPDLRARFTQHTFDLFQRHGLEVAGFWVDPHDENRLVYLLRFADEAAMESAWAAFRNDPDWQRAKAESEKDGPIVSEIHSRVLQPAPFWQRD